MFLPANRVKTLLIRPPATYPREDISPSANTPVVLFWIPAVLKQSKVSRWR